MMITTNEVLHKIIVGQENDECIKVIKNFLQQGQNDEYILKKICTS